MKTPSSLLKPISQFISNPRFFSHYPSTPASDIEVQVQTILDTLDPIEEPLETLVPFLSSNLVTSILQGQHDIESSFRLFNWAMKRKQFRDWESHNSTIDMLCGSNGFELAWKLLEELKISGIAIIPQAFVVLISAYKKMGMAEKAVESFGRMKEFNCRPNTFTYNTILHLLVEKELFVLASAVYNQMLKTDCRPNRATYGILIDGHCKAGKFKDAHQMLDEMTERGISPNTNIYTIIISGLCQAKETDNAYELFLKMKSGNCRPDLITYNALLNGFCKMGRIDKSLELLESFRKEGFVLGLNGYSCLIDGLFRAGRFYEACDWYRMMCQENIVPDCVLYTIMIKACAEAGKVKDARMLLSEMTGRNLILDTFCYNTLIKGFRDLGFLEKDELKLLCETTRKDLLLDTFCYNTLIKGYCSLGLLDEAKSLKLKMSNHACFPDSATCTILICALCKEGLIEEAKTIFEEMEKHGCFPTVMTYNALINGLCKAGDVEEARLWMYKMESVKNPIDGLWLLSLKKNLPQYFQGADPVPDAEFLQKHVEHLCDSGLILEAYKLLLRLVGVVPNTFTYNILINGMCKERNVDGARKLLSKAPSPDAVTYGTLIDGYQRVNREKDALALFDWLKKGCTPTLIVYKTVMTGLCRKGKVALAFSHWLEYVRRGLKDQEKGKIKEVEDKFESGDVEAAVRDLLEMDMRSKMVDPSPYTIWLIGFVQAQRVDEALKIFCVLDEYNIDVTPPSCVMLINGLCRKQKVDLAVDVFLYTLEKGFTLMPPVCNLLITSLCYQDRKNQVRELLTRMRHAGYNLDDYLDQTTKAMLHRVSFISDY